MRVYLHASCFGGTDDKGMVITEDLELKKKSYIYIDFQKENTIFAIMTKINNSMPVIGSLPLNGRSYDIRLFDLHFNTPTGGSGSLIHRLLAVSNFC